MIFAIPPNPPLDPFQGEETKVVDSVPHHLQKGKTKGVNSVLPPLLGGDQEVGRCCSLSAISSSIPIVLLSRR